MVGGLKMDETEAENEKIGLELKEKFNFSPLSDEKRNIRLPSKDNFRVKRSKEGHFEIFMTKDAIKANMQENKAAFEAWALFLRVYLGAIKVSLAWKNWEKDASNDHTRRFELRVFVYKKLFSEWFSAGEISPFPSDGTKLLLNLPSDHKARAKAKEEVITNPESEADYEKVLAQSEDFKRFAGLQKLDRQLPVGVFKDEVKASSRHFSGGKSAVDLVGLDSSKNLHLFELKRPDNNKVGAISELLFYASVFSCTHSTAQRRIKYDGVPHDEYVNPAEVKSADKIFAHILGFELHPLLNCPAVFDLLNAAAASGLLSKQPVSFSFMRMIKTDSALSFCRVLPNRPASDSDASA
jgi:hypothetical protein